LSFLLFKKIAVLPTIVGSFYKLENETIEKGRKLKFSSFFFIIQKTSSAPLHPPTKNNFHYGQDSTG